MEDVVGAEVLALAGLTGMATTCGSRRCEVEFFGSDDICAGGKELMALELEDWTGGCLLNTFGIAGMEVDAFPVRCCTGK